MTVVELAAKELEPDRLLLVLEEVEDVDRPPPAIRCAVRCAIVFVYLFCAREGKGDLEKVNTCNGVMRICVSCVTSTLE